MIDLVQVIGHPLPDGIVAAREPPSVVGMKTFDPDAGATDATTGAGALMVGRDARVALGRVAGVGGVS